MTGRAIFAGGCFWGVEHFLGRIDGVESVRSGYIGGTPEGPTYREVCTGATGHAEAVEILFDPNRVSFEAIARRFFEIHDPTTLNRQGPDTGTQYRSAIFYLSEDQRETAEQLIAQLRSLGFDVVTVVEPSADFYPAEDYHQQYTEKHPEADLCHNPVARFEGQGLD